MKEIQKNPSFNAASHGMRNSILYTNQISPAKDRMKVCKEVFLNVPIVMYTVKNFWLLEEINEKIKLLKAAGLIDFWNNQFIDKRRVTKENNLDIEPKVLKISQFYGGFGILTCGMLISFVAFMVEKMRKN